MKVTYIGGGNIGTLMAAESAMRGHDVTIYTSHPEIWNKDIKIIDSDQKTTLTGHINRITADLKDAVKNADVVFITYPPQMFFSFAKKLMPLLKTGQCVGVVPGAGGAEFTFRDLREKGIMLFGLQRVHCISRLEEYGKTVKALGHKPELFVGSIPAGEADKAAAITEDLLGIKTHPTANYLSVTLTPSNPILHTSRIVSMFNDYKPGTIYPHNQYFYKEWTEDAARKYLECSNETQELCKAIPLDLRSVEAIQKRLNARTPKELAKAISNVKSLATIKSPVKMSDTGHGFVPDFESRYFKADFPYGVRILMDIGDIFDLDTPMIDSLWDWYEKVVPVKEEPEFRIIMSKEEFLDIYK